MVSKKLLKDYEIETKQEYFDIVIESHINGQFEQAKNQYQKMSKNEKKEFILYLKDNSDKTIEKFFFNQF